MRQQQKIINLYRDSSVCSIKHVISIGNEEDLNQFWHYFHSEVSKEYKFLYRFIGVLYAFTARLFEKNAALFFELIIEQNETSFYFTVWNTDVSEALSLLLGGKSKAHEFRVDKKRITVKLDKETSIRHEALCTEKQNSRVARLMTLVKSEEKCMQEPYDFLDKEDREEILDICAEMVENMARAKKHGFNNDLFTRLRSDFSLFSLALAPYTRIFFVSNLITECSVLMNNNKMLFEQMPHEQIALIEDFVNNIEHWAHTLFVLGGADLHFMDSSLKEDLEMIKRRIVQEEVDADAFFEV
jgi:hypothetical protein